MQISATMPAEGEIPAYKRIIIEIEPEKRVRAL